MPGETAREAVDNYVTPLQKALSCVTNAVLGHKGGIYVSPKPHVLTFANTDGSVPLSGQRLSLSFVQHYSIVQLEADQPGGHLPTGRVALEDVLTFILEQFNVRPLRNNWREVLVESADLFKKYRSWA